MGNIKRVAVIGAGMIGLSMCALLTGNGVRTLLYVRDRKQERFLQYCALLKDLVEDGLLTETEKENCQSYFQTVDSYDELLDVDIAFECAAEKLEIKKNIFEDLAEKCRKLQVVASMTSSISSQELAEGSLIKEKILVAHPFYPPHLIPGIEVVPNTYTSPKTLSILTEFLKKLNREVVILKKDAVGFVANRLQYAMLREAVHIVEEGIAEAKDVDRILRYSFAPRYTSIGIFEHFDNCGLALTDNICQNLYPSLSNAGSTQDMIRDCLEQGRGGIRQGQGIYIWAVEDVERFRSRVKEPYKKFFSWAIPREPWKD